MNPQAQRKDRRASVISMTAILMPVLLGMVAISVDMGYIVVVQGQLQNAADAAALAGVSQLVQPQLKVVGGTPSQIAALQVSATQAARGKARQFSALNTAGGVSVTIPAGRDSDIVVGYQSSPGGSIQATPPHFPNAVQVTVRRDALANTPLPLFFAPALGISNWSGTASATAALSGNVTGFSAIPGVGGDLLPIAVDYNYWTTYLTNGLASDGQRHDVFTATFTNTTSPGTITNGADGIPEYTDTYPNKLSPGNFGLISIGPDATDTPTYRTWFDYGNSYQDTQWLISHNRFPASPGSPKTWIAGPGLKSTLVTNMNGVKGQRRVVPLFNGLDNNGDFRIVGFAGVTIVGATGHGNNMEVTLQPAIVVDRTAANSPTTGPGGIVGGSSFVYSSSFLSVTK